MYRIVPEKSYIKALKRLQKSGAYSRSNFEILNKIIDCLASGEKLPSRFRDHPLVGNKLGLRECHIKHDLLLVYQMQDEALVLLLINIGTHNQVFK